MHAAGTVNRLDKYFYKNYVFLDIVGTEKFFLIMTSDALIFPFFAFSNMKTFVSSLRGGIITGQKLWTEKTVCSILLFYFDFMINDSVTRVFNSKRVLWAQIKRYL